MKSRKIKKITAINLVVLKCEKCNKRCSLTQSFDPITNIFIFNGLLKSDTILISTINRIYFLTRNI